MKLANLATVITENRKSTHIVNLINELADQNIPTFIQTNREHLEGYFASERQRKFVVVDNFDGDVRLGSDFTSAAIYLIGYPKRKQYSENIYCQFPNDVVKHYRNFSKLGTITFGSRRRTSETTQISKISTESQSKIRLKSVVRINAIVSTSSMTSMRKAEEKKHLLIYAQGNQNNDYSEKTQLISNKFQKSKIIKTISQLRRFFQEKKRNQVFILASDLNLDKILHITQYNFQVILHCMLESKCMGMGQDSRVIISSTDFEQINQYVMSLNFAPKTKKTEYFGPSITIFNQPKKQQVKQTIQTPKKSILKKIKREVLKPRASEHNTMNQYFAQQAKPSIKDEQKQRIKQKIQIDKKNQAQKIDFAVQSSLAQIPFETVVSSKINRSLKISSQQVSICQRGDPSKRENSDSSSQFSKQSKTFERQGSARSIQENQGRTRVSSSNINVNIIMKPSYPQNQYKIRQQYGVNSNGQQVKRLKIPKLTNKFDKLSDSSHSRSSISSNSRKKIVLKKKLIHPQIQESESARSLSQSIKSNRSKKLIARQSKNSLVWKDKQFFNNASSQSSFKIENAYPNNDSGYYTGDYFPYGHQKQRNYLTDPYKNTDPTHFIKKKQNRPSNHCQYFQRTFPQGLQTFKKSNIVFLIENEIYKENFDGRSFLGQKDKAFIHYNKNQLSQQIAIQESKSEFILIISPFFTQKIEPKKIMRVEVDPHNTQRNVFFDSDSNILVGSYSEISFALYNKLKEHSHITFNRITSVRQIEAVIFDEKSSLIRDMVQQLKFKKGQYQTWKFFAFENLKEYISLLSDSKQYQERVLVLSEYNPEMLQDNNLFRIPQFIVFTVFINQAQKVKVPYNFAQKVRILHVNQYNDPFDQLQNIISELL